MCVCLFMSFTVCRQKQTQGSLRHRDRGGRQRKRETHSNTVCPKQTHKDNTYTHTHTHTHTHTPTQSHTHRHTHNTSPHTSLWYISHWNGSLQKWVSVGHSQSFILSLSLSLSLFLSAIPSLLPFLSALN